MAKKVNSLRDLLLIEIKDLYDAENRLTKALPKMAKKASNTTLKTAIEGHLRETENQVTRLEKIFKLMGEKAQAKTCEAMKGLITEAEEALKLEAPAPIRDAMIIAAAQRVEHYEIAGYGTCKCIADLLGMDKVVELLDETLEEEKGADKKLTNIAQDEIYQEDDEVEEEDMQISKKSA